MRDYGDETRDAKPKPATCDECGMQSGFHRVDCDRWDDNDSALVTRKSYIHFTGPFNGCPDREVISAYAPLEAVVSFLQDFERWCLTREGKTAQAFCAYQRPRTA